MVGLLMAYLNAKIDGLNTGLNAKIDGLRNEMNARFEAQTQALLRVEGVLDAV
jgi:outer membrane murein-binding lipoprotein Lpp